MNRFKSSPDRRAPLSRFRLAGVLLGMTVALAVGPLLVSAPFAASLLYAQEVETHELGDGPVAIYNLVGSVRVEGASGSAVRVEVQRRGPDADRLEVAVDRIDGRQALRVRFPENRIVYREADGSFDIRVNVADDGTFYRGDDGIRSWISRIIGGDAVRIRSSGRGLEAWADVRVLVPEGSDMATYLAAGSTWIEGVVAETQVKSGQGRIDVRDTRGSLSLDTGSVDIAVSPTAGARLVIDAGGRIDVASALSFAESQRTSGYLEGRLGDGSGRIDVDTGSGGVRVRGS